MRDYTVELDQFSGPLDLLLHLVRRDEVAIETVSIGTLTEQYLAFLDRVPEIDVDLASDFLVMAAQLLELKARALLPDLAPVQPAEGDGSEPLTAHQLIANLLEYRTLQEESWALAEREAHAGQRRARTSARSVEDIPLRHVDVWDLVTALRRLEDEVAAKEQRTAVIDGDAEPVHLHIQRLREQVRACAEELRFASVEGEGRAALVAAFLALLELIRLHEVRARQDEPFGPIWVSRLGADERDLLRAEDALHEAERIDPGAG